MKKLIDWYVDTILTLSHLIVLTIIRITTMGRGKEEWLKFHINMVDIALEKLGQSTVENVLEALLDEYLAMVDKQEVPNAPGRPQDATRN